MCIHASAWFSFCSSARVFNSNLNLNSNSLSGVWKRKDEDKDKKTKAAQPARSLTPLRPSARPSRVTCAPPPLLAQRAAPRSARATRSPSFADNATPPVSTFSFPSFSSSPRPNSSAHATAPRSLCPCAVDRPSPQTHWSAIPAPHPSRSFNNGAWDHAERLLAIRFHRAAPAILAGLPSGGTHAQAPTLPLIGPRTFL